MPKSFVANSSSRKIHLLYGTAVGVLFAIGASEKVYADCQPAATAGPDIVICDSAGGPDAGGFSALAGDDTVTVVEAGAVVAGALQGNEGNDTISMTAGQVGSAAGDDIRGNENDDLIIMTGGVVLDDLRGDTGNDRIVLTGGSAEQILGGDGNDFISMGGGDLVSGGEKIVGGLGNDTITISGGQLAGDVNGSEQDDQITITGGSFAGNIRGGADDDVIYALSGNFDSIVRGEAGDDSIVIGTGAQIFAEVSGSAGNDQITMLGGSARELFGSDGNDVITMDGGNLAQEVQGDGGNDQIALRGSAHVGFDVLGGLGNDVILVNITTGSGVEQNVEGNEGNDQITMTAGRVGDDVEGDEGNDVILINIATGSGVEDQVLGDAGNDTISIAAGRIGDAVLGDSGLDSIFVSGGSMGDVLGQDDNDLIEVSGTADLQSDVISGGAGDDVMRIATVGDLSGADILGEEGNDIMELAGTSGELSGADSLFGGSGSNDIAQFSGFEGVLSEEFGAYEQILLLNGSTLDVHNPNSVSPNDRDLSTFTSGGDNIVFVDPTSTLFAGGTSPGDTTVVGNFANLGQISMLDGTANDVFTITGAYAGGGTGTLAIDAELDISEIGDEFFIGTVENVDVPPPIGPTLVTPGSLAEGTTAVAVNDVGNGIGQLTGNQAGDGIAVIDVSSGSTDEDDFFLLNGPIQAGAVEYSLVLESDDIWYLQSEFLDQVFGYAGAPSAILTMARDYMGNLRERVGSLEQTWTGGATQISDGSGVWMRSGGFFGKVDSGKDEQEFDYKQDHWFAQVGADLALLSDASTGQLIGSIMGHAGYSNTRHDENGNELITENFIHGYGGGVALTWYGGPAGGWAGEGMYVDGIAQVTFYDMETKTQAEGKLGETDGWGWSIGLEAGYGINIGGDRNGPRLIPQIQIVYSQLNLDDFTDDEGVDVEFGNADSLEGRLGVAVDSGKMWRSVNAYAEANVVHEFLGDTDVTVTTLPVDYDLGGTSVELGLGGTVSLLDNVHLYADVDYLIPFNDGRQGASVIGGLRIAF